MRNKQVIALNVHYRQSKSKVVVSLLDDCSGDASEKERFAPTLKCYQRFSAEENMALEVKQHAPLRQDTEFG